MELLAIEFLGKPLRLEGSMAGFQQVHWDNTLVSQLDATTDQDDAQTHAFTLRVGEDTLQCHVETTVQRQTSSMTSYNILCVLSFYASRMLTSTCVITKSCKISIVFKNIVIVNCTINDNKAIDALIKSIIKESI